MDHYIINMTLYGALHCREGVLACVTLRCVCVCVSDVPEVNQSTVAEEKKKVFLDVCNVWNICLVCYRCRGRAGGEERRGVPVTLFPSGSCQHKLLIGPTRVGGGGEPACKVNKKFLDGVLELRTILNISTRVKHTSLKCQMKEPRQSIFKETVSLQYTERY